MELLLLGWLLFDFAPMRWLLRLAVLVGEDVEGCRRGYVSEEDG